MTRCTIGLLITLAVSLVVAALATETSPSTIGHRIGWLRVGFPDGQPDPREEAFWQGMHDLGYVEGRNLFWRSATRGSASSGSPTSRLSWSSSRSRC